MRWCEFELNSEPMSLIKMGRLQYRAFSGETGTVNQPESTCELGGPIPRGGYYVVDRESGGFKDLIAQYVLGRKDWFALYASDSRVDDEVLCNRVMRGQFRLHPRGPRGISQGCVVIDSLSDFGRLRAALTAVQPLPIRGSHLLAYAMLEVR